MTLENQELDTDAKLRDSTSSANLEVVESDKIMGAILDILGLHKIDISLISLVETQPSCIEDRVLNLLTMTSWEGHPSQDTWLKST